MDQSRLKPATGETGCSDDTYARIERAIAFLRARHREQPTLDDLAAHVGLSAFHTQRLFSRWAGISPKRFVQFLSVEYAKQQMVQTPGLMSLSLDAGLSGPGRLHDLFVNLEAMSPGEFKRAAAGLTIRCGCGATPFGAALVAFTPRGICHLSFVDAQGPEPAMQALRRAWPGAVLQEDPAAAKDVLARIFARPAAAAQRGLSLWVSGTNFQIRVWRALLQVPFAGLLSYRQLAELMGQPAAARPLGNAVARNPVAFLIPCHRVLRGSGDFGAYHWGSERKMAICAWEASAADGPAKPVPGD